MKGDSTLLLNRTPDGDILDAAVDGIMYSWCSDPAFLEVDFVVAAQISNINRETPASNISHGQTELEDATIGEKELRWPAATWRDWGLLIFFNRIQLH